MAAYSSAATDVTHGRSEERAELAQAKGKGHDDPIYSELLQALKAEEAASVDYARSELTEAQIDAFRRYYGDSYGDEEEGRSSVVTREVFESIEWLRPDLRRVFTAGGRIVEFEGTTEADDAYANDASDLINHSFFVDNPGEKILDDFTFDGLLQRNGFIAADWLKKETFSPAQEATGLNLVQVGALMLDPETQIEAQEVVEGTPDEAHPDGVFYNLVIRKRTSTGKAEIFCVAPEDIRISARATDLDTAPYVADVMRIMKGDAKRRWPEYAEDIDAHNGDGYVGMSDERRAERFRDLEGTEATLRIGHDEAQEIAILREYVNFDKDGDGFPEKLRVFRLGDCILDCDEIDEHIYSTWTPTPIPHKLYGLSINDHASDLQKVKTVVTRSFLDSVYHAVNPRLAVNEQTVDLDDLLTVRAGANVRVDGSPAGEIVPIGTTDLSGTAINAMAHIDNVLETRTGVTRHSQGLNPDALNKTARGIELLQNAANARKEQYAHNLALGLQHFFMKLYRLHISHQNEARSIKVAGKWRTIDPRKWTAHMRCTVSVGLGTGARDAQLTMLSILQGDQEKVVSLFGSGNPIVTPEKWLATVEEKARVMGFKDKSRFFGDAVNPDGTPWRPAPPKDPEEQKLQVQAAEGKLKLQAQMEAKKFDFQLESLKTQALTAQEERSAVLKAQTQADEAALKAEIARLEMQGKLAIEREVALEKVKLSWAQFEFEKDMKLREFAAERELAILKIQASEAAAVNGSSNLNTGDTQFGGDIG